MFWFKLFLASVIMGVYTQALAQEKPKNPAKQDSTYENHYILLDSLLVTPNKELAPVFQQNRNSLTHGNAAHKIAAVTELTSAIPGITADLERDLPGRVTFYSANGFPILTKQSQNHSLTPTMAYAAINATVGEPTAFKSGPDAVVTLIPTYDSTRNMILDPLHQRASFVAGEQKTFSVGLVAEHASPGLLEEHIEELSAYAKTYSGLITARVRTPQTKVEVTGQHQTSENEFGAMFDVNRFQESDFMSTLFASVIQKWGVLQIETGYGYQIAKSNTEIDELYLIEYNSSQGLRSKSYKFSLQVKNTSLAAFYHDVTRSLSESASEIKNTQVILTHEQAVTHNIHLMLSTRVDYHDDDYKQSISGQLLISPIRSLIFEVNAAHLYDPITSHVMNSSIRYATDIRTDPIATRYASLQTRYTPDGWELKTNMIVRNVEQYWYNQPSKINGVVLAASIMRTFTWGNKGLSVKLNTRKRWINLSITDQSKITMPGPPPLQAGFSTEFGTNRLGLLIDTQIHLNRSQTLTEEMITPLGDLFLLNAGFTTRFGPLNLGITVSNVLGNMYDNKLYAYQRRINGYEREIDYIKAPFIPGISAEIDF